MSLIRYEPYTLLDRLQTEFLKSSLRAPFVRDNVADDNQEIAVSHWRPAVDIREEKDRYIIHADLPGVVAKDIEITMEAGVLTLKGERASDKTEDREGYKRVERVRGTFYRSFSLPDTADATRVEATSKDGVLEIILPKLVKSQPRRITVNS
jgi:HSP20 family protein